MNPRHTGVAIALVATVMQVTALSAQTPDGGNPRRIPLPQDWSHRHLIYSAPASLQDAVRLQNEPRYWHQWLRRSGFGAAAIDAALRDFQNAWQTRWAPQAPGTRAAARALSAPSLIASSPDEGVVPLLVTSSPDEGVSGIHRDWGMSLGTNGTVGNGMSPAKFSFDVNATPSCALDFVVFNTSNVGGANKPSIIAYNQLYSTQPGPGGLCNTSGPSVMWSYTTNVAGNITNTTRTSTVLSLDGSKVVYLDSGPSGGTGAILHILKWKLGQGTLAVPVAPDHIVTSWPACVAGSCIVNIALNGGRPATISAPFYDYSSDALYVGDDNGVLHKFFPVLNGTPVEVTTSGWPITVHSGAVLAGPIFDAGSGNIFVGDGSGTLSYVRETTSTIGTCSSGGLPCLGTPSQTAGGAGVDAPIVDSSTGRIFAFDGTDGGNGTAYQIDTALTNGSIVAAGVGGTGGGSAMFAGAFDNAYTSSANGTGHLFVCGKDPNHTDRPAIHRITITAGLMNNFSDGSLTLVSGDQVECSAVTEVYNTAASTDWIFFSVGGSANQTAAGCSATVGITGCLMSLNLTALASWPPPRVTQGYRLPTAPPNQGSTSGIIIDNVANTTSFQQASSLYFSFLNNAVTGAACNGSTGTGCAVKLTQSGLQ
jgi:hypothetical protein